MAIEGLPALRQLPHGAVVTIGNFDGVHLGHRALIAAACEEARRRGGSARVVVVAFDPHPATVLRPEVAPLRLTLMPLREQLLREAGADEVVILSPSAELLAMEAEAFFAVLRDPSKVAHLVEGADFRFGRARRGTVELLAGWSAVAGVGMTVVPPVEATLLDRSIVPVSSSLIRWLAGWGRVRDCGRCLGSPLRLVGTVVQGYQRGRTIGFPTANLDCVGNAVPMDGVYAGRATVGGEMFAAAINVGPLPTFSTTARQIEAHLIGFSGDLYGQTLEVELLDFLRDPRKFAGIDELKAQLSRDVARAVEIARGFSALVGGQTVASAGRGAGFDASTIPA